MPASDRSAGRNVHIYDFNNPTAVLGGLILTNGVTNANLYAMINIIVTVNGTYYLRNGANTKVPEDDVPLLPGSYYIVTRGSISVTDEPWLFRTVSRSSGTPTHAFRDAIRQRDRRCIISGQEVLNAIIGFWTGFEAAHVFPLAQQEYWRAHDYDKYITKLPANGGAINSVQNGLLLRSDIHQLFDSCAVSINPDDKDKVVFFVHDGLDIAGRQLDQSFLNNPDRPVDELLRWHFKQSVLANMRGAGEPIFEHDFPPGTDMVEEIQNGPMAAKRMEFELSSRLEPWKIYQSAL